jgi:hypothetical protein
MAHHVAELTKAARNTRGRAKVDAEDRCRRAILELWAFRREVEGQRPTEKLEPLINALAMLNPDETDPFYYRDIWRARREESAEEESAPEWIWLDSARTIDAAARNLIGWSLGRAASEALDQSMPWIELARKAGAHDDSLVMLTLRLRSTNPKLARDTHLTASIRRRLDQLDQLRAVAATMEAELRLALEQADRAENVAITNEDPNIDR